MTRARPLGNRGLGARAQRLATRRRRWPDPRKGAYPACWSGFPVNVSCAAHHWQQRRLSIALPVALNTSVLGNLAFHRTVMHSGEASATVSCIACIHLYSIIHHLLYLSWIHSRSHALMSVMLLVACELMKHDIGCFARGDTYILLAVSTTDSAV